MPKFCFISGLPRSGSTLLAAILLQNPEFSAGMSTPLSEIFVDAINSMSTHYEGRNLMNEKQRIEILRGIVENFYLSSSNKKVIFDTSRRWPSQLNVLVKLWPNVKIICCVRDVGWIADSLERIYRDQPWAINAFWEEKFRFTNVRDRMDGLKNSASLVGGSLATLNEALAGEYSDHLFILDYDIFTRHPKEVLKLLYEWIEEPYYEGHDLSNILFSDTRYDTLHGISKFHSVRPQIGPNIRKTILPKLQFEAMSALNSMWSEVTGTQAKYIQLKDT